MSAKEICECKVFLPFPKNTENPATKIMTEAKKAKTIPGPIWIDTDHFNAETGKPYQKHFPVMLEAPIYNESNYFKFVPEELLLKERENVERLRSALHYTRETFRRAYGEKIHNNPFHQTAESAIEEYYARKKKV